MARTKIARSVRTAGVSELKTSLSAYLRKVKAGEDVLITERGRPVARLSPIGEANWPARIARMVADGRVTVGSDRLPKEFWSMPRPSDPKGLVLRALLIERESGR